jgi:glutamate-1-semialdehyde 2,1-aminomutase
MPTASEIDLAELLCHRIAGVQQIRFMNSGTEAVMMAVKAARAFTGRPAIAKFEGCYHGTYDTVEVSQAPRPENWGPKERPFGVPLNRGTPVALTQDTIVLPFNDLPSIERLLSANAHRLAGVLIDLLPSHLGYLQFSPDVLRLLRAFADASGALLMADEVYSLRLDYQGAQHRFGVRPDLTVLGKIIGGGLPIGAVGGTREVMSVFDILPNGPAVVHGGTYNANPMSMVAGLASMQALGAAEISGMERLGDELRAGLAECARRHRVDLLVAGMGSLTSVNFGSGPIDNYRDRLALTENNTLQRRFHRAMLDRGVLIAPYGLIVQSTPMGRPETAAFLNAADDSLQVLAKP